MEMSSRTITPLTTRWSVHSTEISKTSFLWFFHILRWTPMFGHLRGKLSYNGLLVWVSISSRAEGQVLAPQLFYFGRRNGRVSMQRNVVKWNTDPGMKTSKTAAGAIDLHAAFSLVPSLIPLSYMALGVSLPRAS